MLGIGLIAIFALTICTHAWLAGFSRAASLYGCQPTCHQGAGIEPTKFALIWQCFDNMACECKENYAISILTLVIFLNTRINVRPLTLAVANANICHCEMSRDFDFYIYPIPIWFSLKVQLLSPSACDFQW